MHCCDFLVLKILFLRSAFIRYGLLLRYSVICKLKNFLFPCRLLALCYHIGNVRTVCLHRVVP